VQFQACMHGGRKASQFLNQVTMACYGPGKVPRTLTCRSFSVLLLEVPASPARARAAATLGGITGGLLCLSRGAGCATCMRYATSWMRLPCAKPLSVESCSAGNNTALCNCPFS
jgi:hypothetical protein